MKSLVLSPFLLFSSLPWSALSLLVLPDFSLEASNKALPKQQKPIMPMDVPGIVMPGSSGESKNLGSDALSISDVIGKDGIINIFAGFTRDIETISKRLDDSSKNTTVLAPLNSALQKLPRKPWEDPKDYGELGAEAYKGSDGEDRAHMNLRKFVEAHIVPVSPWKEGEKVDTVGGGKVWWEEKEGTKRVQPGDVEVSRVANRVSNGEVWVLKGCLNYE